MSLSKRLPVALGGLGAVVVLGLGASFAVGGEQTRRTRSAPPCTAGKPKNVIFFLGDGMGTQEITAARYYQYGAAGRMNVDRLPFTGFQTTWSVKPAAAPPYLPDYDPDSASTGTMWATGEKTIDERISQGPSSARDVPGKNLRTVLEVAQKPGKRTGNVSTAEITDATPAVLNSHISLRGCQGPNDTRTTCPTETKAAGGLGSIAEQTVDHKVDVVLGGGRNRFQQPLAGGRDDGKWSSYAKDRKGYHVRHRRRRPRRGASARQAAARPLRRRQHDDGVERPGRDARRRHAGAALRDDNRPAERAEPARDDAQGDQPARRRHDGFFLQVEGASIDKQDHAANACGQIGETVAFDDAIGVALEYQRRHPDTLIVVTADHAHTSQIVAEDTSGTGNPTGYSNNLITADGQTMRVTYGTAGGTPPAAPAEPAAHRLGRPDLGPGPGRGAILGTTDHTDLFDVLQGDDRHHGHRPGQR